MALVIFFAIVCVLEVLLLIGLGFAYWGLVQADKKLRKARVLIWDIRAMALKRLHMGEVGIGVLKNSMRAFGLFMPWWIRAFMLAFKVASKIRMRQTA